jgi:hypothetical protein
MVRIQPQRRDARAYVRRDVSVGGDAGCSRGCVPQVPMQKCLWYSSPLRRGSVHQSLDAGRFCGYDIFTPPVSPTDSQTLPASTPNVQPIGCGSPAAVPEVFPPPHLWRPYHTPYGMKLMAYTLMNLRELCGV